jgi:hypothetical protein
MREGLEENNISFISISLCPRTLIHLFILLACHGNIRRFQGVATFCFASGAISSPSVPGWLPWTPRPRRASSHFFAGPWIRGKFLCYQCHHHIQEFHVAVKWTLNSQFCSPSKIGLAPCSSEPLHGTWVFCTASKLVLHLKQLPWHLLDRLFQTTRGHIKAVIHMSTSASNHSD